METRALIRLYTLAFGQRILPMIVSLRDIEVARGKPSQEVGFYTDQIARNFFQNVARKEMKSAQSVDGVWRKILEHRTIGQLIEEHANKWCLKQIQ